MKSTLALACIFLATPAFADAQAADAAAERARIANQRIEAEAARQAQEEEKRQQELARREAEEARLAAREAAAEAEQEKQQLARIEPAASPQPAGVAAEPRRPSRAQMDKALEQLRTLGELKDAGYVTEDEFERIKQKILDATE